MKTFFGESNTYTITFPVPYFVFDTRHARGERTRVNGCGIYCLCIQYPSVRGRGAWTVVRVVYALSITLWPTEASGASATGAHEGRFYR